MLNTFIVYIFQISWLVIPGNVRREGRKPRMICNNTFDEILSIHTGDKCCRNNFRIEIVDLSQIRSHVNPVVGTLNSNINNVVLLLFMKIRFHVKVLPKHITFWIWLDDSTIWLWFSILHFEAMVIVIITLFICLIQNVSNNNKLDTINPCDGFSLSSVLRCYFPFLAGKFDEKKW